MNKDINSGMERIVSALNRRLPMDIDVRLAGYEDQQFVFEVLQINAKVWAFRLNPEQVARILDIESDETDEIARRSLDVPHKSPISDQGQSVIRIIGMGIMQQCDKNNDPALSPQQDQESVEHAIQGDPSDFV